MPSPLSRVAALAATATILACSAATAQAEVALNVIPHGQQAPGVPWAADPGMLPADTQARMYDRITPLFRNITDNVLIPSTDGSGYFKSSALVAADDPSLITSQTVSGTSPTAGAVSATIKRDAYGVPHIFSDTDAGAIFGAGYVEAVDQSLLIGYARYNGIPAMLDIPGVSAIQLVLGLYDFKANPKVAKQATDLQNKAIAAKGADGKQLLADIDTYLAGANTRMAETGGTPLTRTDIYAANAIKDQFLGEGGGQEIENALFLATLRQRLGKKSGTAAFNDLQANNDPEAAVTTDKSAPAWKPVAAGKGKGEVSLRPGSFKSSGIRLPGAAATAASADGGRGLPPRQEASNILIASGKRSATGAPLFVGGPQIGFNYPGLTIEMQIKSPSINVRGATSAPFPGYMLIGRGQDYAWTLTSAGADLIDTYAETLCGGSRTKYLYKGKCRKMEKIDAGTISKGGKSVKAIYWRTVHGPVQGYAKTDKGKTIALTTKRSSYGRDAVDLLYNQRMTYGRVKNAADYLKAAEQTPQTFNSFYASKTESAFYTAGALPQRKSGVNPTLPVDGRGNYEWTGEIPTSRHPQVVNPASGLITNWNNKPAKNFPAGDDRFGSEGGLQRVLMLDGELARHDKLSLADVLSAETAASSEDVRIVAFWPTLKAMLAKGKAPSATATKMAELLDAWHNAGGARIDANNDGKIDDPGAPIMDGAWNGIAKAGLCARLGAAGCKGLETRQPVFSTSQYAGWHQYMDKDLRTLLRKPVKGKYALRYCGKGVVKTCAKDLWAALDAAGKQLTKEQGADPAAWRAPEAYIQFSPIPLFKMQWSNKPTGIQQVMTFGP